MLPITPLLFNQIAHALVKHDDTLMNIVLKVITSREWSDKLVWTKKRKKLVEKYCCKNDPFASLLLPVCPFFSGVQCESALSTTVCQKCLLMMLIFPAGT